MSSKNPPNALAFCMHVEEILLYNVLKFNQISSIGMAIILVQKSAKIRTLNFLSYLALFSYLSRMLSVNPWNFRLQNSFIHSVVWIKHFLFLICSHWSKNGDISYILLSGWGIISKGQVSTSTSHDEQRQHTTGWDQQVHALLYESLGPQDSYPSKKIN